MPNIQKGETVKTVPETFKYEKDQDKADDITFIMKVTGDTSDSTVEAMLSAADYTVRKAYLKAVKDAEGRATGGMVDELGYMHGGMPQGKRGPIKYATGGAVRGKRFVGTF